MEKIIMGIDPGTNIMGYGLLRVTSAGPEAGPGRLSAVKSEVRVATTTISSADGNVQPQL